MKTDYDSKEFKYVVVGVQKLRFLYRLLEKLDMKSIHDTWDLHIQRKFSERHTDYSRMR